MVVTGVIAEYNPFHNGHLHQLAHAKDATGADYMIVVMSGDYTQRGEPALMSKYDRARMALESGADLVIELPVAFATGSAEYFAKGAVSILKHLGVVDHIAFGSECGDIEALTALADILLHETPQYQSLLRSYLKSGLSYPQARMNALETLYPEFPNLNEILSSPNNILGIEYIKALRLFDSAIRPYTEVRVGSSYHAKRLSESYSSALSIRQSIENDCTLLMIQNQVPPQVFRILQRKSGRTYPISPDDYSAMLQYKLITERRHGYSQFYDVSEEFGDRVSNLLDTYTGFQDFSFALKTKDMTYTRVCRSLLHILLNIRQSDVNAFCEAGYAQYIRILGFREDAAPLLGEIASRASIPVITQPADYLKQEDSLLRRQLEQDIDATCLYQSVVANKFHTEYENELTRRMMKI